MMSFAVLKERVGGKHALSLRIFLLGSPFWVFGFVLNENASFSSVSSFITVLLITIVGQIVMGLTLWLGHLGVSKRRTEAPIPLTYLVVVWASSALTRLAALTQGFAMFGIPDDVPLASRIVVSGFMAVVGYAIGSYGLDAYDRFRDERARLLAQLLSSEEQLATHRVAVETMTKALLTEVDSTLQESISLSSQSLTELEDALASQSDATPALEELRTLSDSTWHSVRQVLRNTAPAMTPRIGLRELLALFAGSGPFRLPILAIVSMFLYLLVYSRAFDWLTGFIIAIGWLGAMVIVVTGLNALLRVATRFRVTLLALASTVVVFSAIPLLAVASVVGVTAENPLSVVSVHAISLAISILASLPPTVALARRNVVENLQKHMKSATLEKLHVEGQLAIATEKIASHLHGDVRGNLLSSILNLQRHIAQGDNEEARSTIAKLRALLTEPLELVPSEVDSALQLDTFISNWSAILDIEFDTPLSSVPQDFMPAFHTVVVDAVNNAVRHGDADWIRVGFTLEPNALALNIRNNGNPRATARVGLGTIHLNQLAPGQWSRFTNEQGMTQLVVRLERANLGAFVTRQ